MYSLHTKLMNLYSVKVPMIRAKGLNSLTSAFRNRDGMCSMLVNLSRLNMEKCACLLDRRHLFNWQELFLSITSSKSGMTKGTSPLNGKNTSIDVFIFFYSWQKFC